MFDFNSINKIASVKEKLGDIKNSADKSVDGLKEKGSKVESTANQMIKGFSLYGLCKGFSDAIAFAASSIEGLTKSYQNLVKYNPEKVKTLPKVGYSVPEMLAFKGHEIKVPEPTQLELESAASSLLPNPPQPQHISKSNAKRVLNETGQEIVSSDNKTDSSNGVRSKDLKENVSIASIVENVTKITKDIENIKNMKDHISKVAEQSLESIKNIDVNPEKFLSKMCDSMKELAASYVHTFNDELSKLSEIGSSKKVAETQQEEKNYDKLKEKLESKSSFPSMPGNLFYLATKDSVSTYNPDLNAKIAQLKQNNPENKTDSQLLVSLLPEYAFPGYNSLDSRIKTAFSEAKNIESIKQNPGRDMTDMVAAIGIRDGNDYEKFKELQLIDVELKKITVFAATIGISFAVQSNHPVQSYYIWLLKLKSILGEQTISDKLIDLFSGRTSDTGNTKLSQAWDFIFNTQLQDENLSPELNLQKENFSELRVAMEVSNDFTRNTLPLIRAKFPTSIRQDTARWKATLQNESDPLGFQGNLLLLCLLCLDRIKILAEDTSQVNTLKEGQIMLIAKEGKKYASYLSNGEKLVKAFSDLGG